MKYFPVIIHITCIPFYWARPVTSCSEVQWLFSKNSAAEAPSNYLLQFYRYLNKKKTAEEMEQQYQQTSSVDYSLKDGETLVLQLKNVKSLTPII